MPAKLPPRLAEWDESALTTEQIKNLLERFCSGNGLSADEVNEDERQYIRRLLYRGAGWTDGQRAYPEQEAREELFYLRGWVIWCNGRLCITEAGRSEVKIVEQTTYDKLSDCVMPEWK